MHDRCYIVFAEYFSERAGVCHVSVIKLRRLSCYLVYALCHVGGAVVKVVNYDYAVSLLKKLDYSVAAYEASAACGKYGSFFFHVNTLISNKQICLYEYLCHCDGSRRQDEAALRAVRDGRRFATQSDLEESIEVVIAGYQKKNAILTDKEKWTVAYHEIGHALVAALQTHSAPVQKITIIPRTSGALGYTMQVEEGNHYLMSKTEMENKIATLTGGRAAEEVVFHSVTTGASNDIEQATKLARAMITRYGMSDDFDMVALETVNNQYLGGDASLACSAETQTKIDQRVVELVKAQHEKAIHILTENRAKLDELAQYLYEKETITGEEFMKIVNEK